MSAFFWIIVSTFFISIISFIGALTLVLKESLLNKILPSLVAFSAGALLGSAFLHLIPEAIRRGGAEELRLFEIFLYLILGFCVFFVLEQFIGWHHHHETRHPEIASFSYLILISDGLHNFIDGLFIAGSFLADFQIGIITGLAIILHEIPQEIGDFGVLIFGGLKKSKALFLNFLSALAAISGGVIGYLLLEKVGAGILFLLPFTAGGFIYIAAADLIPQIRQGRKPVVNFLTFLAGIIIMILFRIYIHAE
jgi:zinc and cadmium transporter